MDWNPLKQKPGPAQESTGEAAIKDGMLPVFDCPFHFNHKISQMIPSIPVQVFEAQDGG